MHLSWQVVVTLSVSAVLVHTAGNLAEASNERLTAQRTGALLLAQAPTAGEPTEPMEFNIPPQPLGSAITAFADQANYRLLVPSDMAEGRTTSGVSGRHTPEEALTLMLAGTGLGYRMTEARTMTLEPATLTSMPLPPAPLSQEPTPTNLNLQTQTTPKSVKVPEIVVKDVAERGYVVDESSSATRIPVPIEETPRAVQVVTRQVLDDQKVIRFSEALRNVSGVSQATTQGGQGGTFMIRGFASDLNVFKNGFRDDSTFGSRAQRDVINIESIDVVKGPPSYLYGRSDPGGVINQITKAPLKERYYSTEMIIGSYGLYRPQFDIGGPLNASKTLTYRFNGMYESAGSYRDGVYTNRIFLAPTIGWEAGSRTTFRFEGEYFFDKSPIDRGLVAISRGVAPIPITSFLGDPTRKSEVQHGKATLIMEHWFNDMFKWRSAFRAAVTKSGYSSLEGMGLLDPNGTFLLGRFEIPTTVQSHYLQNELHGVFSTGSIKHKTIIGIELGREVSSAVQFDDGFGGLGSTINIFNTNIRSFINEPLTKTFDTKQVNNVLGGYFGDHISLLENLHVHAGGRLDLFEQNLNDRFNSTSDSQTNRAFSPSVGIAYLPWKPITLYANYTESFAPQTAGARSATNSIFDPERGKALEGGVKLQAFDNRLRANIAVFDIRKKNVLTPDPNAGFLFSVQTGAQRSKGIEFDIAGKILPGWDIIANYAYIDARITQDNVFALGSRVPNSALHQGSLWTTYFFQEGVVKGFGAGVGMYAQGKRNGIFQCQDPTSCQDPFDLEGYVRMDAALYYRKQEIFDKTNVLAALNFTNVLGQRYFTGAQNFREIIYTGAPFTVIGSLKFEFH